MKKNCINRINDINYLKTTVMKVCSKNYCKHNSKRKLLSLVNTEIKSENLILNEELYAKEDIITELISNCIVILKRKHENE
ncbi:MAG: hypothetical protein ABS67_03520 [Niabella sp. SCN 42-15]|nr:MAG: hypothetical protein ABS67_03520 [Niabella sp. SCN 42-15]